MRPYTATVQFSGAGGTSEGAQQAGIEVEVAINHSQMALATHQVNHPQTVHIRQSMEEVDPDLLPDSDFLLTSPCCTNHSIAKGQKQYHTFDLWGEIVYDPLAEKSRNTMDDVVRFASAKVRAGYPYKMMVVENVVDVVKWWKYASWLEALTRLGYEYQVLYWNTQFFGVPQSRDRVYLVFWQKNTIAPDLVHRPVAVCAYCEKQVSAVQCFKRPVAWGRYGAQYVYRCPGCVSEVLPSIIPVGTVLDRSWLGSQVGTRLSPNTIANIIKGIERYQGQPFLLGYYNNAVYRALSQPVGTITTLDRWALVTPGPSIAESFHRMLTVEEVKVCMGFPASYQLLGNNKEQVWMLGNAVCPAIMTNILARCVAALAQQEVVYA